MVKTAPRTEQTSVRRPFWRWSIAIPADMDETFVEDGGYWHAWDERRSISLTSMLVTDEHGRAVPAHHILEKSAQMEDEALPAPNELLGWSKKIETPDSPLAGSALTGILAVDGGVLLITVTSDDLDWSESVWRSIRHNPVPEPSRRHASSRHRHH